MKIGFNGKEFNKLDLLILLYIFSIYFLTIYPFQFISDLKSLYIRFSQIDWIPFMSKSRPLLKSDILANIAFFIPIGGLLSLRELGEKGMDLSFKYWIHILIFGASISLSIEFFQIFTTHRHVTITDFVTNSLGCIIGAILMTFFLVKFKSTIKFLGTKNFS